MRYVLLGVVVAAVAIICGCGGSGTNNPIVPEMGTLSGQLVGAANVTEYKISIDGQELDVTPGPDGTFTVPNVPPGDHTVSFVGGSGMEGAHMVVTVDPGGTTDIGDITPGVGGQIVGLVMKKDAAGNLAPLAGVEVIADPNPPVYIMSAQDPGDAPLIAPPTRDGDLVQVRAITDERGSYVIPAVPEGSYIVTVNVPGLNQGVSWVWVSPGTTAVADFQLEESIEPGVATLQGTVLGVTLPGVPPVEGESGPVPTPLEGATVSVTTDTPWMPPVYDKPIPLPAPAMRGAAALVAQATGFMMPPYRFDEFKTLTDAAGRFSLNVPSGYVNVSVWAEGYDGAWERLALKPDTTTTREYTLHSWPPAPGPGPEPVPLTK